MWVFFPMSLTSMFWECLSCEGLGIFMGDLCRFLECSGILFRKKENLKFILNHLRCSGTSLPAATNKSEDKGFIIKSFILGHQVKFPRTTAKGKPRLRKAGWGFWTFTSMTMQVFRPSQMVLQQNNECDHKPGETSWPRVQLDSFAFSPFSVLLTQSSSPLLSWFQREWAFPTQGLEWAALSEIQPATHQTGRVSGENEPFPENEPFSPGWEHTCFSQRKLQAEIKTSHGGSPRKVSC